MRLLQRKTPLVVPLMFAVAVASLLACVLGFIAAQPAYAEMTAAEVAETVPVYQLYNPDTGFWRWMVCESERDESERDEKLRRGWIDEGVAWYAPERGTTPVYCAYNPNSGEYHYTSDANERDNLAEIGWETYRWNAKSGNFSGPSGFQSDPDNATAIYRVYDAFSGRHYYTTSPGERDAMVRYGWMDEGVANFSASRPGDDPASANGGVTATLEVLEADLVYDGSEKRPVFRLDCGRWWEQSDGNGLGYADDPFHYRFDISYSDNVNAGTATVQLALKSNPEDTLETTFEIAPRPLDGATVVVSDRVYTGEPVCPEPTVLLDGKELVAGTDYALSYADNVEPGTATVTVTGQGNYTGTASKSFNISVAALPQYRLYNPWTGEHFYTSSASERANVLAAGWADEGEGWRAPQKSNTPVFRMYNPYAGEHHYCMTEDERDGLVGAGWEFEGIGWYSDDEQRVPLYREYNPNEPACNHNYTTDKAEHDGLVAAGWVDEGYAWYGM